MQISSSALVVLHAKHIKMDWEKILQAMEKQEKQKRGTLSPQHVSCLPCKGTQSLQIVQL